MLPVQKRLDADNLARLAGDDRLVVKVERIVVDSVAER
jgi:hypothetical protein